MRSGRVLVAVDDPARREVITTLLREAGHELMSASPAEEASPRVPQASPRRPEVVLLSPAVLSEVATRWRELAANAPHAEAVVIAALDDPEALAAALRAGVGEWLSPEVPPSQLVAAIEDALARARRRHEQDRLLDENLSYLSAFALYERAIALLSVGSLEPLADRLVEALCLETRAQSGVLWVVRDDDPDRLRLVALRGLVRARDEDEEIALGDLPREPRRLASADEPCFVAGRDAERLWVPLRALGRLVGLARLGDPLRERGFAEADCSSAERLAALVGPALACAVRVRGVERGALRDPDFGTYSLAVVEDATRREIDRASRFGRVLSLVELRLDGTETWRGELPSPDDVARRIGRCLRASDLLASDGRGRFRMLLPETDSLGAAVMKRRIQERVDDLFATVPGRLPGAGVSVAAATHPIDGRTLDALEGTLSARLEESRTSLLRTLGAPGESLAATLAKLAGQGQRVPAELPEQLVCFALAEVARRPDERGLVFVSTGSGLSTSVQEAIERLRGVDLRTEVVVLCDPWPDALAECGVTRASPRRLAARHPFLVRFGEGPSFALVRGAVDASDAAVFQTSDRPLVEHLAFRLQRELAAPGVA